ncbi:MAG: hypothetical protein VKP63_08935 [Cyanobacteriota bacterium]|nr:hypothetical protein [Cyanobacteriota bacterium]
MDDLYQVWLRLRVRHGHLTTAEGAARAFTLRPMADTAVALRQLQLALSPEAAGCSVLLQPRQRQAVARWLERSGGGPLQWRLVARAGALWGCTAVPMNARCRQWHLHGSARAGEGDGTVASRLLPVAERELPLTPPAKARLLRLLDGQGTVVREQPIAANANGEPLRVSLDHLPEGLLQPSFGAKRPLAPWLHLTPQANAIGVLSVWLPAPAANAGPLEWTWDVPGRQTIWHYLVVPRQAGDRFTDLRIVGDGCVFLAPKGPEPLPDGRQAWRLVGQTALPLLERSPLRFRLEGQREEADGHRRRLVVDPLPVAPPEPVWPSGGGDPLVGVSEMVVPV